MAVTGPPHLQKEANTLVPKYSIRAHIVKKPLVETAITSGFSGNTTDILQIWEGISWKPKTKTIKRGLFLMP